jgi:PDZ domain
MFFEEPHRIFQSFVATQRRLGKGSVRIVSFVAFITFFARMPGLANAQDPPSTSDLPVQQTDTPGKEPSLGIERSLKRDFEARDTASEPSTGVSETEIPGPDQAQVREWIQRLESDSFASRHLAYQLLQPHPTSAIRPVEKAIATAEQDAAHRLIRLLGGWSTYPDVGYGIDAFAALERIARSGVSTRASFAKSVIEGISEDQADRSEKYLKHLGAYLDFSRLSLFGFQQTLGASEFYLLRLDDAYRGTVEDLRSLRWINSVEIVRLEGERIDRSWLMQVVRLPNLRILQIRHTSITGKDIELLQALDKLEGLEIMYTPIDDDAIETLSSLPLANRMRLFGTQMSEEGVAKLRELLDGSEIMFGRGGFLGISCDGQNLTLRTVNSGSGAEKAGLRAGDYIRKIDGNSLNTFDELRGHLAKRKPGEQVTIEFYRRIVPEFSDGEKFPELTPQEVKVILGEQP